MQFGLSAALMGHTQSPIWGTAFVFPWIGAMTMPCSISTWQLLHFI